ncbi:ketopantoate hydroxymethyltransferase [Alteribacillus persepolensis]|uniref:3-methyl-2-oxobutanoate hydroxymethyltransferase n=1 Tax=Alteribacillus persepolensis TaxID=568899 RepID=A0A1G7ZDI1_9BACI|nr:3-methyl-2-oxobutanoate hydroxymethyltransferase [Alteribacillus persepolensis]SDH06685.1 ketopantoate hydroxymethyltransferase [Alteribacillus persepolensis]
MKSISTFMKMKQERDPIAMMTAYDAPSAKAAAKAGVDMILVGDSVGMAVHGYDSTIPVTLEDMLLHSKAVRRGAPETFVVTDLPFLTYQGDFSETLQAVKQLLQEANVQAVKLEGAKRTLSTIQRLSEAGVPVIGHLGLTPQSVGVLGGYKVQGRTEEAAKQLIEESKQVEKSGAVALVLECVPRQVAAHISSLLDIPVIGIGAGSETDGQVLVFHDVIGFSDGFLPKFVKQYAHVQTEVEHALSMYVSEVKQQVFPGPEHTFSMSEETLNKLYGGIKS